MLYKDQTMLDLEFETGVDLAAASVKKIIMVKPGNQRSELEATHEGTKLVFINPAATNTFDQAGIYKFQGKFVIEGREGRTSIVEKEFHKAL